MPQCPRICGESLQSCQRGYCVSNVYLCGLYFDVDIDYSVNKCVAKWM